MSHKTLIYTCDIISALNAAADTMFSRVAYYRSISNIICYNAAALPCKRIVIKQA